MGLDLYVGTPARYYTGRWETETQRVGREAGLPVQMIYANGEPRRLARLAAPLVIARWRRRVEHKFAHLIEEGLTWSESGSKPYLARKPDHDARQALVLAGAYAEHPEIPPPQDMPATTESDPAYAAIGDGYLRSVVAVLECHMFVPSGDSFLISARDALGVDRVMTTTAALAWALDTINRALWQADDTEIARWARRGPLSKRTMVVKGGRVTHMEEHPSPDNAFAHSAQFGFAIYSEALRFSQAHNLPILTDE